MRDLYVVLGVEKDADAGSIRKAYRQLARQYHPDINPNADAGEVFAEISKAYDILSDENRRKLYDEFGEASLAHGFDPDEARAFAESQKNGAYSFDHIFNSILNGEDPFPEGAPAGGAAPGSTPYVGSGAEYYARGLGRPKPAEAEYKVYGERTPGPNRMSVEKTPGPEPNWDNPKSYDRPLPGGGQEGKRSPEPEPNWNDPRTWEQPGRNRNRPSFSGGTPHSARFTGERPGNAQFGGAGGHDGVRSYSNVPEALDSEFGGAASARGHQAPHPNRFAESTPRVDWTEPAYERRQGEDLESCTQIDIITAIRGGETFVILQQPGPGGTIERQIKVLLPAGVVEGQIVRVEGQGRHGRNGAPRGDLLLAIGISEHPLLKRRGPDLEMDLPVTVGEAVNGAIIVAPTPDGEVKVRIPPGCANGARLRLRGRGMPVPGGERGDLFLVIRPTMPANPSQRAQDLAREFDALYDMDVRANLKL